MAIIGCFCLLPCSPCCHHALKRLAGPLANGSQVPSVWTPLQLIGATAGAAMAFILPGALALSLDGWQLRSRGGAAGLALIPLGALLAVAGIAGAVI